MIPQPSTKLLGDTQQLNTKRLQESAEGEGCASRAGALQQQLAANQFNYLIDKIEHLKYMTTQAKLLDRAIARGEAPSAKQIFDKAVKNSSRAYNGKFTNRTCLPYEKVATL